MTDGSADVSQPPASSGNGTLAHSRWSRKRRRLAGTSFCPARSRLRTLKRRNGPDRGGIFGDQHEDPEFCAGPFVSDGASDQIDSENHDRNHAEPH